MAMSWSSSQEEDTLRYLNGRLEYSVRVRGSTFLWGSSGLTKDLTFASPLILHIANDRYGQVITLNTRTSILSVPPTVYGTLQPGEVVSLPIQGIAGVFAQCAEESIVRCVISILPHWQDKNPWRQLVPSAQIVKLTVAPSAWANLSFEVGGILQASNATLNQKIPQAFDFTTLYSQLGVATEKTSPANLLNSSDLEVAVAGLPLMSLRAEGVKGMLDKACALRANIYIAKFLNQTAIIAQMRANLTNSTSYLQDLVQRSSTQASALAAAYATDGLGGVVKTTSSNLSAKGTGTTTETATGTTTANSTKTTTTSTTNTTAWPTQNMTYQDYGYRYPSIEAAAQNDRAQLSLMAEQFAVFMAQGTSANLETVFSNELTAYDMDVKRLQVAYLNTMLLPPIIGTVTGIYKQVGEAVLPGETVMRIEDTSTIYLVGTLICRQMVSPGSAATITTNLFGSGTTGTLNGSVLAARGDDRGDDWWNVVISCPNSVGIAPNCTFDYEDTTVTIA